MKRNKSFLTAILVLVLFSCKKDIQPSHEKVTDYTIVGNWEWCSSYFYGNEHLPENTGIQFSLYFGTNDSVLIIENSDTVFKAKYILQKEFDEYGTEIDVLSFISDTCYSTKPTVFAIGPRFDRYIIKQLTDTLKLKEYYFIDGFHTFHRGYVNKSE